MIIDGEKWACEACVRGHRVSNCQHSDRPLQHINRKGRPVSQCQHCRSMRKSRASHVKCDCGEKTHKCTHMKSSVEGHKSSCCCNHGGRCTCSHKKEQPSLDTVPESDSDRETAEKPEVASPKTATRRRRANTSHSDGMLTFDENGHHKPTYKHSKASQKVGPYQLSRVNSVPGSTSVPSHSVDSLSQDASRSSRAGSASSAASHDRRHARSETTSPLIPGSPSFGQLDNSLTLDLSGIEYPAYAPNGMFSAVSDADQALFSAGLSATPVDWSHYDLDFSTSRTGDNFPSSGYSQAHRFGGVEFNGSEQAPTLTTTGSGEVSEVEDFMGPNIDDYDTGSTFATSAGSSAFELNAAQASMLARARLAANADFEDLKFMKNGNKFLPTPASLAGDEPGLAPVTRANNYSFVDDDAGLWMGDYHGLPATPDANLVPFWDNNQ